MLSSWIQLHKTTNQNRPNFTPNPLPTSYIFDTERMKTETQKALRMQINTKKHQSISVIRKIQSRERKFNQIQTAISQIDWKLRVLERVTPQLRFTKCCYSQIYSKFQHNEKQKYTIPLCFGIYRALDGHDVVILW